MESEYERQRAEFEARGYDAEAAHQQAFKGAKDLGTRLLEELRRRGVFPWQGGKATAT